jgi:[ribosomal protein S18]-alanine N-acetyltransferase
MTVCSATAAEVPALAAIHAQCFTIEVWDAAAITALLATPGTLALVDDAVTGFILVRAAGGESEILTLAVTPAARRRGIASTLVEAAAKRAFEAGAEVMFLEVNASNYPAIALYKRLGFNEVGVRHAYYAGPHGMREDALVLRGGIPLLRVGNSLQLG